MKWKKKKERRILEIWRMTMKKVYDNATFVANYLSWDIINCSRDGQMKSIEEISDEVYKVVV